MLTFAIFSLFQIKPHGNLLKIKIKEEEDKSTFTSSSILYSVLK